VPLAPPACRFACECGKPIFAERHLSEVERVLIKRTLAINDVYVPTKRRLTLNARTVREIAESILEVGQQTPIMVRQDGERFVLVEGFHRLEACKMLGEQTIVGVLVQARKH
jgi:sulfiredoxin